MTPSLDPHHRTLPDRPSPADQQRHDDARWLVAMADLSRQCERRHYSSWIDRDRTDRPEQYEDVTPRDAREGFEVEGVEMAFGHDATVTTSSVDVRVSVHGGSHAATCSGDRS